MNRWMTAALALTCALALAACGDDDKKDEDTGTSEAPAQTAPEPPQTSNAECKAVDAPKPKEDGGAKEPSGDLEGATRVKIATNCGDFTIEVDPKQAPKAGASFVSLAEQGFYDGTIFHRIVPGFVIQGGDPTGQGTGGPGYTTEDDVAADTKYTRGVVAMAKSANDPPGGAGSQFYVVTGEDAGLPPEYAVIGKVVEGEDVVEKLGELGDPATEQPTETVVLERATAEK